MTSPSGVMAAQRPPRLEPRALAAGVLAGDRAHLGMAITLVESANPDHRARAQEVLESVYAASGRSRRIGITGVPGVGKSTTIEQLGLNLVAAGHRVAVLAVDPSSQRTGGSILGDKTRMARLSQSPQAFIRPSPTSGTLGGVARRTRETITLVEAAGFDTVIVETVGVGQSETTVAGMVDVFVVLILPGGGDDLQGIKKGVIELADMIAVNKSDGDARQRAERTAADYRAALGLLAPRIPEWQPPVITMSGLTNDGLDRLWSIVEHHQAVMHRTGAFGRLRAEQSVSWMREHVRDEVWVRLMADPAVKAALDACEADVRAGRMLATRAVDIVLNAAEHRDLR
ncbi:MAG: methylmalonyl Co-A mutase-associated GTPase MeaB [Hyphomicrobiaceae bacterium]